MIVLPIAFAILAHGQQQAIKARPTDASVLNDNRPVTCAEGYAVFSQARAILNKRLKANLPASSVPQSSQAMTKEQIVAEMSAINRELQPQIRLTLLPQKFSPAVLKIGKSELAELEKLIRDGYVGKVSPLATNPLDSLTVKQFGDALGFFLSRTAEVTHLPSSKWSPNLGAGSQ